LFVQVRFPLQVFSSNHFAMRLGVIGEGRQIGALESGIECKRQVSVAPCLS